MNKFKQLSRTEMKNVTGAKAVAAGLCGGTVTCGNGSTLSGLFDCSDMTGGGDGDDACGPAGESTSCDCDEQPF